MTEKVNYLPILIIKIKVNQKPKILLSQIIICFTDQIFNHSLRKQRFNEGPIVLGILLHFVIQSHKKEYFKFDTFSFFLVLSSAKYLFVNPETRNFVGTRAHI